MLETLTNLQSNNQRRPTMKTLLLTATLFLTAAPAFAQEDAWVVQQQQQSQAVYDQQQIDTVQQAQQQQQIEQDSAHQQALEHQGDEIRATGTHGYRGY